MYNTSVGLGRDALLDRSPTGASASRRARRRNPRRPARRGRSATSSSPSGTGATSSPTPTTRSPATRTTRGATPTARSGASTSATTVCSGSTRRRTGRVRSRSRRAAATTRRGARPAAVPGALPGSAGFQTLGCPASAVGGVSAYVGKYHNPANPHNPMMDAEGRIWITTQIRREWQEDIPAHCRTAPGIAGRGHHRQLGYYNPKTKDWTLIDTCFGTHHLQFDKNGVLWTSGDSFVLGWFDPKKYDPAAARDRADGPGLRRGQGRHERRRRRRQVDRRLQLRGHPERRGRQRLVGAAEHAGESSATSRAPASSSSTSRRSRAAARGAWTLTRRASSGPRWAAPATSAGSTAPSARRPGATASSAPRAGRSTSPRAR